MNTVYPNSLKNSIQLLAIVKTGTTN